MDHDFTPDDVAPWPEKIQKADRDVPAAADAPLTLAEDTTKPLLPPAAAGPGRELVLGALVVLLSGGGTLAMLITRDSAPPTTAASGAPGPRTATPSTAAPSLAWTEKAPRWIENGDAWLGKSKGAAFEVSSAEPVGVWMRTVRPALVVRCTGKRAEVFVFTDTAAAIESNTDDHTVSFAVDGEEPTTMRWPDGAEHNALFAPDGPALAQRLMHADSFTLGFTPHNAGAVTARFRTTGLADALKPSAKSCGW
jgi:hypothetical protein